MEQLLLHLLGDYIIQNDYVALNKKKNTLKGWIYCIWHCLSYAIPFILITNIFAVAIIATTHLLIDKTNIVSYFLKHKNFTKDISNFGCIPERPFAISIWLNIYADNTIHLIGNYLIIKYIVI